MKLPKLNKESKILAALIIVLVPAYIFFNAFIIPKVITPQLTDLVLGHIAGAAAIQKSLQTTFPNEKVRFSASSNAGQNGTERTLVVNMVGDTYLTSKQLTTAQSEICTALGQNYQTYTAIYVQTSKTHTWFDITARTAKQPLRVTCP